MKTALSSPPTESAKTVIVLALLGHYI